MPTTSPGTRVTAAPVRYDYLDALRGWAILGVLAVHGALAFPGALPLSLSYAVAGRYGVQLFFMVSAYTIVLTLDRARRQGRQDWTAFFIRRGFRILPLFWMGIVLYALVPGRLSPPAAGSPLDYVLTALLQHGWHPTRIDLLVPGGWSIAAEGTFYLLVPLCYGLIRSWQAALWLLLGSLAFAEAAFQALAGLYNGHRLFADVPIQAMPIFVYGWFPAQMPVFACGILVYQLARAQEERPWSKATGAVLLATGAMAIFNVITINKRGWITEHVFFALAFVPLMLGLKAYPARLLVNPVTRFLGKISYSVYLLHFAVLTQVKHLVPAFHLPPQHEMDMPTFLLTWGLTILGTVPLAWLSYRCVEQPGIDLGGKVIAHSRTLRGNAGPLQPAGWPTPAAEG